MIRQRFAEARFVRRTPSMVGQLVVACILDEFSAQCFGPEAELVHLTPAAWQVELSASQPDLLLIESAWRGHRDQWWNTVSRIGPEIRGILEWCRERDIPTAFWNKEDPVHFATFLDLAAHFDAVFTTDLDCVPRYKAKLGHERVHYLPFAAQPVLHNPLETFERTAGVIFAGAYYTRYPERTADLDALFAALAERGPFAIYDRNHGKNLPDYAFPPRFEDNIVGGLAPSEISRAYKGARWNLNLNSVKQSQSMFARRVFELLASGTMVVSNFSRGLRLVFGDLVVATDDGAEAVRCMNALEADPLYAERVRMSALRKVLREHTYSERLAYIAGSLGVPVPLAQPHVLVLIDAAESFERVRWAADPVRDGGPTVTFARIAASAPSGDTLDGTHRGTTGPQAALDDSAGCATLPDATASTVWSMAQDVGADLVTYFDPADHYGPHHLSDMVHALGWLDVSVVGRSRHFSTDGTSLVEHLGDGSWCPSGGLSLSRSLVRVDSLGLRGRAADTDLRQRRFTGVSIDPFQYLAGGAGAEPELTDRVHDPDIWTGRSLGELRHHADTAAVVETEGESLDVINLFSDVASVPGLVELGEDGSGVTISSMLPEGQHRYLYSFSTRPLSLLRLDRDNQVYLDCDSGLHVLGVVVFLSEAGERLGHSMLHNLRNSPLDVPPGAAQFRIGVRVLGPGRGAVRRIIPHEYIAGASGVLPTSATLVLSNIYPSYERLYRNGFVHSRVRAYREQGIRAEVVIPSQIARPEFREFADVDVVSVIPSSFDHAIADGQVRRLLVHFLSPPTWAFIRRHPELERVIVWVHGSDIQPWERRAFNLEGEDEATVERTKSESDRRMQFWAEVMTGIPRNVHFVFVSDYLAETAFQDIGHRLTPEQYSVIHNPIDRSLFRYQLKDALARQRILSIRPYASRTYANDLSVRAVLLLKDRPGFENLQFRFVGDGPLFEETLAPIAGLSNVVTERAFLTHSQIARLHSDYGVFLAPTRMDSHGVSRDEAMSSGLVPVTTRVAAVPEFLDDDCGILVPPEDPEAIAEAIWSLAHDPERFLALSAAATARVARQAAAEVTLPQELALIDGAFGLDPGPALPAGSDNPTRDPWMSDDPAQ